MRLSMSAALALVTIAAPAFAQDTTTIGVADSEEYGEHLVTDERRPVYLFTTDTQGTDSQDPKITCTSEDCLNAWPLVTVEGDPQVHEKLSADMLGTIQYDGQTVVTYNGWPLYYFVRDEGEDAPQGQDIASFGGEWYLVTPDGEELHAE